jgi:hypothetical protein
MVQPQQSRFYLPFLLVLTGILPSPGCSGDVSDEAEHSDSFIYVVQERQDRVWIQRAFQEVPLHHPVHKALLQPVILELYAGDLYIYDFADMQLKRFARDGRLLNTIGTGRGQGPGEFVRIVDYYAKDSMIWVLDGRAWSLSQFDIDGTFISRSVVNGHMFRITQAGDHFITMTMMSGDLFYIVDSSGQRLQGFGGFLIDEVRNGLALDGGFGDHDGEDVLYLHVSFPDSENEGSRIAVLDRYDARSGEWLGNCQRQRAGCINDRAAGSNPADWRLKAV